jgi:hypothetical protein
MEINFRIVDTLDQWQRFDIIWTRPFAHSLYTFSHFRWVWWGLYKSTKVCLEHIRMGVICHFTYPHWKIELTEGKKCRGKKETDFWWYLRYSWMRFYIIRHNPQRSAPTLEVRAKKDFSNEFFFVSKMFLWRMPEGKEQFPQNILFQIIIFVPF